MVTNNQPNNRVNLEQVCSLNIEQSRLLQKLLIIIHLKRGNQLSANETQLDWDRYQESLQEGKRTVLQCSS